ncbi:MAG: hypothetical protein ABI912_01075 [Actinomycetota bacterium]
MTAALRLTLIGAAAVCSGASWRALRRTPLVLAPTWLRSNYRGRNVSLLGGPVVVVTALAGCVAAAALGTAATRRTAIACVVALAAAGAAGIYDDLRGDDGTRGLAGHLSALLRGRPTSGALKVGALAASGLGAAVIMSRGLSWRALADGALIAASANLTNLFDLRPGRAGKLAAAGFAVVLGIGSAAIAPIAWCAGAALGTLPGDVREELMLGDGGANAVGAALGVGLVVVLSQPARVVVLCTLVCLTLLSEKVSFSRVIDRSPPLRWLDGLWRADGERPAAA